VKKDFTYADLSTGDDEMRAKAINGAWIYASPDAGYTPFRGMKGSSFEGGFRVPAIAWWPGHVKPGTVNMDMWSHMDWWPTIAKLAGLEPPPHDWKDNDGNPVIFDGIDLSESLLGSGPGKRDNFIYFNDQSSAVSASRTSRRSTPPRTPGSDRSNP